MIKSWFWGERASGQHPHPRPPNQPTSPQRTNQPTNQPTQPNPTKPNPTQPKPNQPQPGWAASTRSCASCRASAATPAAAPRRCCRPRSGRSVRRRALARLAAFRALSPFLCVCLCVYRGVWVSRLGPRVTERGVSSQTNPPFGGEIGGRSCRFRSRHDHPPTSPLTRAPRAPKLAPPHPQNNHPKHNNQASSCASPRPRTRSWPPAACRS